MKHEACHSVSDKAPSSERRARRLSLRALALFSLLAVAGLFASLSAEAAGDEMVTIPATIFRPPYPAEPGQEKVDVRAFRIDKKPVTNGQFLAFVRKQPDWQRDKIPSIFGDERYLSHWSGPTTLGKDVKADQPVTWVSWFAARAYCKSRGARLPTEYEWELLAQASETQADASKDAAYLQSILGWYAQPTPKALPSVGRAKPNFYGVYDIHGLVWEWISDFADTMVSSDSREGGGSLDETRFCGGTSITQDDKSDYARFMRYAYRGSLQASYTVRNLGFRCAMDVKEGKR